MREELKLILSSLYEKISGENVKKQSLYDDLNVIGNMISEDFPDFSYAENPTVKSLDDLLRAQNKTSAYNLDNIKGNKSLGCIESIREMRKNIYNFLSLYNLGFLRDFDIVRSNVASVKFGSYGLRCFTSGLGHDVSNKIKFQKQMEVLANMGLDLLKAKDKDTETYLLATKNNFEIIIKLLQDSMEAYNIRFETLYNDKVGIIIAGTSFYVKIKSLIDNQFTRYEVRLEKTDILNADETVDFIKTIHEIISNYGLIEEYGDKNMDLHFNGMQCIMVDYRHLCDIVGLENEYIEEMSSNKKELLELEKNTEENTKEILKYIDAETIKTTFDNIEKEMTKKLYNALGLYPSEFVVRGGLIVYTLSFDFDKDFIIFSVDNEDETYEKFKDWNDDAISCLYDIDEESRSVLMNAKNLEIIEKWILKHYPNAYIENIENARISATNKLAIKKVKISFYSMADILCI